MEYIETKVRVYISILTPIKLITNFLTDLKKVLS